VETGIEVDFLVQLALLALNLVQGSRGELWSRYRHVYWCQRALASSASCGRLQTSCFQLKSSFSSLICLVPVYYVRTLSIGIMSGHLAM
jgi:hypothetical protein